MTTTTTATTHDRDRPRHEQPRVTHRHAVTPVRDEGADDAGYVDAADDRRDDPAGLVREEVVRGVVHRLVLDHDHALGLDRLLDHALPDLVAGERDDERRHADEGDERALEGADQRAHRHGEEDRDDPRDLVPVRESQLRDDDARDAADVADREVDLADQEDEDDAVGEQRHAGHLRDDVAEVAGAEEVVGLEREEDDDDDEPDEHRPAAEVAGADVVEDPSEEASRAATGSGGSAAASLLIPAAPDPSRGCRTPSSGHRP